MTEIKPKSLYPERENTKKKPLLIFLAVIGVMGLSGLMYALYLMIVHYRPLMAW